MEDPKGIIVESFKTSYVDKRTVTLFRGAVLINLDAYWSSMRDLDRVKGLAEVIVKIAEFYARNASTYCSDAVEQVSAVKHGLALIALSTMPKIIGDQGATIIIEYGREKDGALNGLGIAELLTKLLADPEIRDTAFEAEKTYSVLKDVKTSIDTDVVEKALLKMASEIDNMTPLKNNPAKSIVPVQPHPSAVTTKPAQQVGKPSRKYGPRVNAIEVRLKSTERKVTRLIVLVSLKTYRGGYITTSSVEKIRELADLKIPARPRRDT